MASVETVPCGIFDGSNVNFTHLKGVSIDDVSVKARIHQTHRLNPFKRIFSRKSRWVPFQYADTEQVLRTIDLKVSHLASVLGIRKRAVRHASKHGHLEELVIRAIWISQNLPLDEVQSRGDIYDEDSDTKTEIDDTIKIDKVFAKCAKEGLKAGEFSELKEYISANEQKWESEENDVIYMHRLDTGLPRSVFWIRGRGAFIKLKGSTKELRTRKMCKKLGISRDEYFDIRRYLNANRHYWDAARYRTTYISKEKSGLARDLLFRSGLGLYIKNESVNDWVFANAENYDPAEISKGAYKRVFKGIQLNSGSLIAIGSAGGIREDDVFIPGNVGITDQESLAHHTLEHGVVSVDWTEIT